MAGAGWVVFLPSAPRPAVEDREEQGGGDDRQSGAAEDEIFRSIGLSGAVRAAAGEIARRAPGVPAGGPAIFRGAYPLFRYASRWKLWSQSLL